MVLANRDVTEQMATEITTVSVHPDRAQALREFRDAHDELRTLDDALGELLNRRGE